MPPYDDSATTNVAGIAKVAATGVGVVALVVAAGLYGCPQYNVYSAKKRGEAQLAESIAAKQVAVQSAKAKAESAEYEKQAEIIRAEGVRKANQIIADGLGGPEGYLRYLYIDTLKESKNQVIYIPTEGALPILEAGRRPSPPRE